MADVEKIKMEQGWKKLLAVEFTKPYFDHIVNELHQMKLQGKTIYPSGPNIFRAFDLTPPEQVKAVILGQDPYHNPGEAMGLCFAVPKGIRVPPSLKNIFKELNEDLGLPIPTHGDLTAWARQGVLLLNSFLTVEKNRPASHQDLGWHHFTDQVIEQISSHSDHIVFILWGNFAKSKLKFIDTEKHLVIMAAHPSPLARGGFSGHRPFSTSNQYLKLHGVQPIDWTMD